jgi:hypothetical protein
MLAEIWIQALTEPGSEARVVQEFRKFIEHAGIFASMCHTRRESLLNFIAGSGTTV